MSKTELQPYQHNINSLAGEKVDGEKSEYLFSMARVIMLRPILEGLSG